MCKQTTRDGACELWKVCLLLKQFLKLKKEKYQNVDSTPLSMLKTHTLSNMILCSPNEKQGKENIDRNDFQMIRDSNLAPQRIMVSSDSLSGHSTCLSKILDIINVNKCEF